MLGFIVGQLFLNSRLKSRVFWQTLDSQNFSSSATELANHYQRFIVPTTSIDNPVSVTEESSDSDYEYQKKRFNSSVADLWKLSRKFHDYLTATTDRGKYLQFINENDLIDLVSEMRKTFSRINHGIVALEAYLKSESLINIFPDRRLSETATELKHASALITKNSINDDIVRIRIEIDHLYQSISVALGQVPGSDEPDQLYRGDETRNP